MAQPGPNSNAPDTLSAPETDAGDSDGSRPGWRFVEGSVSISVSTLLAILLSECACAGLPLLGYLAGLTQRDDGVIIIATLLLFPTTLSLYGVFAMFYAAKEFVEKRARRAGRVEGREEGIEEGRAEGLKEGLQKGKQEGLHEGRQEGLHEGRQEGLHEGRQLERERISRAAAARGVPMHPELAKILADDAE